MSETAYIPERQASESLDVDILDLQGAEIKYEHTDGDSHYVAVKFDVSQMRVSYIIGQFRELGYRVLSIKFDHNEARFVKDTIA